MKKPFVFLTTMSLLLSALLSPKPALADIDETYFDQLQTYGIVFAGICTDGQNGHDCPCRDTGECTLTDIMQVFVNISNFILGIMGSLALTMIVYGIIRWLTSGGNPENVSAGTAAMRGSVIGLLIISGAFTSINYITEAIRGGSAGQTNKCELVSPENGGKAGTGYSCLNTTYLNMSEYTCESNLCPGDASIKCCTAK